jgi:hypothetical protein
LSAIQTIHCGENQIRASLINSAPVGATPTPATIFGRRSGNRSVKPVSQLLRRRDRLHSVARSFSAWRGVSAGRYPQWSLTKRTTKPGRKRTAKGCSLPRRLSSDCRKRRLEHYQHLPPSYGKSQVAGGTPARAPSVLSPSLSAK